ncbi:hypothetical protein NE865_07138 [Phthorimaea operculella]|nr:hypothetical protein NE865_07138 [Phthorimaea operculella]
MSAAAPRKSLSINDYPEHLNPFHEDDNHNKIRFWTLGRRLSRSNSINFSGIKDLKNSWAFRSFMKKGKKREQPAQVNGHTTNNSTEMNGDSSPIVFRRAIQYSQQSPTRSTIGADRYVYGGSVTPLPRSRFQERLRSVSTQEVSSLSTPRLARSEVSDSRFSVESHNPFDEPPVPPVRASRRKKKKAPLPPGVADVSMTSETSELQTSAETSTLETSIAEETKPVGDIDLEEDINLNIELKIVEDEETKETDASNATTETRVPTDTAAVIHETTTSQENRKQSPEPKEKATTGSTEDVMKNGHSEESILDTVSFPKVDIAKYRRNSSVNENDIRLRRGNIEDFHELTTKRSKSLTNSLDTNYISYDINLNEKEAVDANGNEEPQKVVCKLYPDMSRKHSVETISSTEKEFLEIDKVRREIESEINNLNAALEQDFSSSPEHRLSFSEIKRKFDKPNPTPNPIPKPRRSNYGEPGSPVNGNILRI